MKNFNELSDKVLLEIKGLGPKSVKKLKDYKGEVNSVTELKTLVPSLDVNDKKLKEISFDTSSSKVKMPSTSLVGVTPLPIKPFNVLGNLSVGLFTKYSFSLLFDKDELVGSTVFVGYESNLKKIKFKDYNIPNTKKVNVDISEKSFINDVFHIKIRNSQGELFYDNKHKIANSSEESIIASMPISLVPLLLEINGSDLKDLKVNTELVYESNPSDTNSYNITQSLNRFEQELQPASVNDVDGVKVEIIDGTTVLHSMNYFWKNIGDIKINGVDKKKLVIDLPHKYLEVTFKLKETNKSFAKTEVHLFDNYKIDVIPEPKGESEFNEFSTTLIVKKKIAILKTRVLFEPEKISLTVKNLKNERVQVLDPFAYPFTDTKKSYEISVNRDQRLDYSERIGEHLYGELPQKVTGHLVALNGIKRLGSIPIVIEIEEEDGSKYNLKYTTTDSAGRFSFDYPRKNYKSALARIAIKKDKDSNATIQDKPIQLVKKEIRVVEKSNNTIKLVDREKLFFPDHILLVIEEMHQEDEDCKCNDTECGITFNHDGEVLDEFSFYSAVRTTEPNIQKYTLLDEGEVKIEDIVKESNLPQSDFANILHRSIHKSVLKKYLNPKKGLTTNSILSAFQETTAIKLKKKLVNSPINKAPGRQILDFDSQIDWDDEPTIYQATSIAHGHILQYKQEWISDGYSLGDLLYSLPLAPGQKKQIVVFDWERRENATRREELNASDSLDNSISRDRDINEIVRGSMSENMKGGSKSRTGGFGAGLGLAGIFKGVTAVLGVSGGYSGASSSAMQNSSRKTSLSSLQSLRDNTVQSANSVRSQRATVIQTSSQGESFTVQAESVANYNHCHAMTIQYFEVLRHLQIRQRLSSVQECLFIPLMITGFDFKKTLRWRESLSRYIGSRSLRKGFDSIERIENNYEGSDFLPNGRYADELIQNMYGHLYIRFDLARPKDVDDDYDDTAWSFLQRLLPFNSREFYNNFLKGEARKDAIFERELAPKIAERFVQSLRFTASGDQDLEIPLDATLVSSYRAGKSLQVSLNYAGEEPNIRRSDIKYIEISGGVVNTIGSVDLPFFPIINLLPANSKVIVWGGVLNYQTEFTSDYLFRNSRLKNDLTGFDNVQIYTPLNRNELRNPREEDVEFSNNLVDHLNANVEFYHKILWMQMSPERRFMFLDGIKVVDYSNESHPQGIERSVASVVENKVIGVAGNSIIMPVASGFRLDPNTRANEEVDLFDLYKPTTPIEPSRVSIPTKGVFAEAIMGQCNSCEKIDEDRFWRWSQEPIPDSPTEILPIDTSSRQSPNPDLTPTPFSNPMIVQQNAPAAPDPTGIAAASNLLNREFRDMAGLQGTQQNAMDTYNKNMDTAAAMGKEAASMWKLKQQLDSIKSEKNRGNIDDNKAKELSESAIEESFEGGSLEKGINQISKIDELIKNGSIKEDLGNKIKEVILDKVTKDAKQPAINNDVLQEKISKSANVKYTNNDETIELNSDATQIVKTNTLLPTVAPPDLLLASAGDSSIGSVEDLELSESELDQFDVNDDSKYYSVQIYVDQPDNGGDRQPIDPNWQKLLDVGHTFIGFNQIKSDDTVVKLKFGFYPKENVYPRIKDESPSIIKNDVNHNFEVCREFEVTKAQFASAFNYAKNVFDQKQTYNLNEYNCTDFAIQVCLQAEINIPDTFGSWVVGGGSNPGDLGEDLRSFNQGSPCSSGIK